MRQVRGFVRSSCNPSVLFTKEISVVSHGDGLTSRGVRKSCDGQASDSKSEQLLGATHEVTRRPTEYKSVPTSHCPREPAISYLDWMGVLTSTGSRLD